MRCDSTLQHQAPHPHALSANLVQLSSPNSSAVRSRVPFPPSRSRSAPPWASRPDGDLDPLGNDRRVVRHVVLVGEHELNRVRPYEQGELYLSLPGTEVQMLRIVRDLAVEPRFVGIDEKVVVARSGLVNPRGRHAHLAQAEAA